MVKACYNYNGMFEWLNSHFDRFFFVDFPFICKWNRKMSQVQYKGENLEKYFYELLEDFDDSNSKINFHAELSQFLLRRPFL